MLLCLAASTAYAEKVARAGESETLFSRAEVVIATGLTAVLCVVLHYEALSFLTVRLRHIEMPTRPASWC
jgi:hypothetical protein